MICNIHRFYKFFAVTIIILLSYSTVGCLAVTDATTTTTTSSTTTPSTIPRSSTSERQGDYSRSPPWNPSPQIDKNGFLIPKYHRIPGEWEKELRLRKKDQLHLKQSAATIRQVPGDGNCLFHSSKLI